MDLIVILGGGESGVGAALLAKAKGFEVFLSDKNLLNEKYKTELIEHEINFEEGSHSEDKILSAIEVIKSPGIPEKVEIIKKIKEKNIPVISEIEFAFRFTNAKIIGVTGSNGKTTTSLLIYHILKKSGFNVGLAGNIGESFAKQVMLQKFDWYVLEISSFQLDDCYKFNPHIAIITNITPDHLDRYEYKFENYIDSKFRIIQNQTEKDYFIFFEDNEPLSSEINKRNIKANKIPVSLKNNNASGFAWEFEIISNYKNHKIDVDLDLLPIKGPHNALNTLFAILTSQIVGLNESQIVNSLKDFKGPPHRLEKVGVVNEITFINDSKATNVDSVFYALNSFKSAIILIIGGVDKGNDYSQIEELVKKKVKAVICLGKENDKLISFFENKVRIIRETQDINEAVMWGVELGSVGDVVLLSPACASFDLFKNYEDRGNQFKSAVNQAAILNR